MEHQSIDQGKTISRAIANAGAEKNAIQTKLTVGKPGDEFEKEADRVAGQVMRMTTLPDEKKEHLQKKCSNCEEEEKIHRSSESAAPAPPALASQLDAAQGGGSPLPADVRAFMEPRFGADFSGVRVHTDSQAVQMNRDLHAHAFAHKQDIYYGPGKGPGKDELTAHELTHVVQQTGAVQPKGKDTPNIQCEHTETPMPSWGSGGSKLGIDSFASMTLSNGQGNSSWFLGGKIADKFDVPCGVDGSLTIQADVYYHYTYTTPGLIYGENAHQIDGLMKVKSQVLFKTTPEGLLIFNGNPVNSGEPGMPGLMTNKQSSIVTKIDDNSSTMTLHALVSMEESRTSGKTSGTEIGGSGEGGAGIKGEAEGIGGELSRKLGISGKKTSGSSSEIKTAGTGDYLKEFSITLNVPMKDQPKLTKSVTALFDTNKSQPQGHSLSALVGWYQSLPEDAKTSIKTGKTKIRLVGSADDRADESYNLDLAIRRNAEVMKLLKKIGGAIPDNAFDPEPIGKTNAKPTGRQEDRSVVVSIEYAPPGKVCAMPAVTPAAK